MKRGYDHHSGESAPLITKKSTTPSYYIEEDDGYSILDRSSGLNEKQSVVVKYTPSELNEKIVNNAPSLQFQKEANLLVDFIINDSVCVYVRRIDAYMKEPTLTYFLPLSPREVFRLMERQKKREEVSNRPFVQRIFILILNNLQSNEQIVEELCAKCAGSDLSLLLCWNAAEAASLITEMKTYEKRGSNIIRKTVGTDLHSQAMSVLTSIDGINVRSLFAGDD